MQWLLHRSRQVWPRWVSIRIWHGSLIFIKSPQGWKKLVFSVFIFISMGPFLFLLLVICSIPSSRCVGLYCSVDMCGRRLWSCRGRMESGSSTRTTCRKNTNAALLPFIQAPGFASVWYICPFFAQFCGFLKFLNVLSNVVIWFMSNIWLKINIKSILWKTRKSLLKISKLSTNITFFWKA